MPQQEQQELQLRVNLINEATEGLAKFREQLQGLTEETSKESLRRVSEEQSELGKQIKELAETATHGTEGMLKYVEKFGVAGVAMGSLAGTIIVGLDSLKEFTDRMVDLSNKARVIGIPSVELKSLIEQYERMGISADIVTQSVAGFYDQLAKVGRIGSKEREQMLDAAGEYRLAMEVGIQKI